MGIFKKKTLEIHTPETAITPPAPIIVKPSPPPPIVVIRKTITRNWEGIVWHHSATIDGETKDWSGIVKYHTSHRIDFNIVSKKEFDRRQKAKKGDYFQKPWRFVGYHGAIEMVDGKASYFSGRSFNLSGAHSGVKGVSNVFNDNYIGLCAIGNYDTAPPSKEIWELALRVTKDLMKKFSIHPSFVIGHREVYSKLGIPIQKSCPGKAWDVDLFREELKKGDLINDKPK